MLNNQLVYFYHKKDENTLKQVTPLYELIVKNGFCLTDNFLNSSYIICIGDDETFLQGVRRTNYRTDCMYIGVNLFDTPSIYCDFQLSQLEQLVETLVLNTYDTVRLPLIKVKIDDYYQCYCLNEFSIRSSINKALIINISIDDLLFETYSGEGLLISTPQGSSFHNKSLAGAIIDSSLTCMQLTEISSINNKMYRSLINPLIVGNNKQLKLAIFTAQHTYPAILIDNDSIQAKDLTAVTLELSEQQIIVIKQKNSTYFNKLKEAFL